MENEKDILVDIANYFDLVGFKKLCSNQLSILMNKEFVNISDLPPTTLEIVKKSIKLGKLELAEEVIGEYLRKEGNKDEKDEKDTRNLE